MIPGNASPLLLATAADGAAAAGVATKSLRFNSADSAYLSRTPSSAGNRTTWTWSAWIKRAKISTGQRIFTGATSTADADFTAIHFVSDKLYISGYNTHYRISNRLFRDPGAWFHLVVKYELGASAEADKIQAWYNGEEITWATSNTAPSTSGINAANNHTLGAEQGPNNGSLNSHCDLYLADVYFIDGLALDSTSFGAYDSNNVWQAAAYSGTFGTNGFHLLDFANESTVGHDSSGNDNDFTANNLVASAEYKTLTRLRFKTDWNWMYVSQITINGSALTTGTLDNTGSVWSDPDKWKNGSTGSGNETYSQSARQDWFDVTLASNISNFRDLEIYVYLDSSAGSTTNIFEVELFFSDNTSHTKTYASNSDAPNGNFNQRSNQDFGRVGLADPADLDVMFDVPTNGTQSDTGAGGEVSGNYATLNPLDSASNQSSSNGNLEHRGTNTSYGIVRSTIGVASGKWFWEGTVVGVDATDGTAGLAHIGITTSSASLSNYIGSDAYGWMYNFDALKFNNGSSSSYGNTYVTGDIIGVALDMDAGTLTFYKNGTSQGQAFSGLSGTIFPSFSAGSSGSGWNVNFGQRPFAYSAPSGYKALCTTNLPTPTIADPSTAFDAVTYTGNGGTQSITGLEFSPDLVWTKKRNATQSHHLTDTVRGVLKNLRSNTTGGETTDSNTITAFNSDGFTLGSESGFNGNNDTFIAWTWDAGSSTVSNTSGSITSNVRANASAGFSIVDWSASTQSAATIGHGLGKQPELIIAKTYDGSGNWYVFEPSLDTGGTISKALYLNSSAGKATVTGIWGHWDEMTSTTFGITDSSGSGTNDGDMIAYCFTSVDQFSSFGVYQGNGSTDGPFVALSFRPAFLLLKRTGSTGNWLIYDNKREGYNFNNDPLYANLDATEGTTDYIDLLSNGFKIRNTHSSINTSANDYMYAAFAEHCFSANGGLAR